MGPDDQAFLVQAHDLLEGVTRGQTTIPQFERAFLDLYSDSPTTLPPHAARALEEVFWAVENYVDDPDLRDPHELGEGQLLETIEVALAALTDLT